VHSVIGEERRERLGHRATILNHVTHARGNTDVVLEHSEVPDFVTHEVDARHADPNAVGRVYREGRSTEMRARGDDGPRHQALGEDSPFAVDVGEERLEGVHSLGDAPREPVPFERSDQARQYVQGKWSLLATVRERDASFGERV
jgi:hypothetical protein